MSNAEVLKVQICSSLPIMCSNLSIKGTPQYRALEWVASYSMFKKYKDEKFLLPSSDTLKAEIPKVLDELKLDWKRGIFYKTVISDLSDLRNVYYDILVFFSPSGIELLLHNFPDFEQNNTRIAVFGNSTVKAANNAGLRIDIKAPTPETPSMTMALQKYIADVNK